MSFQFNFQTHSNTNGTSSERLHVFASVKRDESKLVDASSDISTKKVVKQRTNLLAMQTSSRLFSNRDKTGDIKFKVGHEEIWAHKCVLAALSPKYETQFYGAGEFDDKNSNMIEVKEVTAAAFTEFLQFFYLKHFQLTHENIEHVFTLAEASLVEEFVDLCIGFLTETVSNENVCQSYYLAMKHGCENLIETCERKLSLHSDEVFASNGFIASNREVIYNILQLDSLNCKETEVFNACVAWAKNFCTENGTDPEDKKNLREAFVGTATPPVNLLHQIRFGVMSIEEFMVCYKSYKNLFTEDEREEILYTIGKVTDTKPKRFNEELRDVPYRKWSEDAKIECNRIFAETPLANFHFGAYKTTFSFNKPILLGGFYCGCLFENAGSGVNEKLVSANLTIIRKHTTQDADGKMVFNSVEQLAFGTKQQATVKLQRPIFIKPDFVYEIQLEFKEGFSVKNYEFKKEVTLDKDTTATFHETQGLVTCLIVNLCNGEVDEMVEFKATPNIFRNN
ncbi:uncharacterized protein LOC129568895 [Sitodiplosis mosellana]|uniref:uncharacterized protein LOC129568895 n=1 Tax=Sitodiplosis mosellana TaxID=263140 RepID=UPI0024450D4F|nr:uncharacterized protein LOC129568895 [Sitodiplosis mosellana]